MLIRRIISIDTDFPKLWQLNVMQLLRLNYPTKQVFFTVSGTNIKLIGISNTNDALIELILLF